MQDQKSGLSIENGMYRGALFTDSLNVVYNIRYMPVTVRNDSSISLSLHLGFSKEYSFPSPNEEHQFFLVPLPAEWAKDGKPITDKMQEELPLAINKPVSVVRLEPKEEVLFAIGALYERGETGGLLPKELFTYKDEILSQGCDQYQDEKFVSSSPFKLGIRASYGANCLIIPCGYLSYSD